MSYQAHCGPKGRLVWINHCQSRVTPTNDDLGNRCIAACPRRLPLLELERVRETINRIF